MANDLKSAGKKTVVAKIERFGEKLLIPTGMKLIDAATLIQRRMQYEEQDTTVSALFDCFPWDGACALETVLTRKFGWGQQVAIESFFGSAAPQLREIEIDYGKTKKVPWGRFLLPNIEGYLDTGMETSGNGRVQFALSAFIKRKDQEALEELFTAVRAEIAEHSIYRGKAMRVQFLDDDGDVVALPMPTFLNTSNIDPDMLVLSDSLAREVNALLFTPVRRPQDCLDNGIPVKRGVLLGGGYGVGKTMIGHVTSKYAVDAGVTFIYIKQASELTRAIEFARQYQSPACVVFVEDIDREMSGDRNGKEGVKIDSILNTIDGIDSKTSNIIVLMTTNAPERIEQAMLRSGRTDSWIHITPPDAKAVERLVRAYAGATIAPTVNLTELGLRMAGHIPAVIAEVVKRAKLVQLSRQEPGTQVTNLSVEALLDSAASIQAQVELLKPRVRDARPALDQALANVVKEAFNGNAEMLQTLDERLDRMDAGLKRASSDYRNG